MPYWTNIWPEQSGGVVPGGICASLLLLRATPLASHVSDGLTELASAYSLESLGLDLGKLLPKFVTDGGGDRDSTTGVPAPFKDCSRESGSRAPFSIIEFSVLGSIPTSSPLLGH